MTGPAERDLVELRTIVTRARAQAQALTREAKAGRAALQAERTRVRAQREQLVREAATALRTGQLGHQERALVERVERGDTSWEAVAHGVDEHWSAASLRAAVATQVEAQVAELREDPEFLEEHEQALAAARDLARRTPG